MLLALALSLFLVLVPGHQALASQGPHGTESLAYQANQEQAEANLPFLYAVYSITWAAFFGYLFLVSRRQREMRREIEALRKALEEKAKKEGAKER